MNLLGICGGLNGCSGDDRGTVARPRRCRSAENGHELALGTLRTVEMVEGVSACGSASGKVVVPSGPDMAEVSPPRTQLESGGINIMAARRGGSSRSRSIKTRRG
jgi:hypothetical protein